MDKRTAPEPNEGGKDSDLEKKSSVQPLMSVRVVYCNHDSDEFEQVENIFQHHSETSWLLTGPGPNIIIPAVNVRYLQVWEMGE